MEEKLKVAVVCQCNLNRSPTVAKFLRKHFSYMEIKDAGILFGYPNVVNQELLDWADRVFVMDIEQQKYICDKFPKHPKIWNIGISDQYDPDEQRLIDLLHWYFRVPKK